MAYSGITIVGAAYTPIFPEGCVIIMDNAAFHKGKDMQK